MPITDPGIKILLIAPNTPLVAKSGPIAYLHLVKANGDTIVPTYEPAGLNTYAGPVPGARYVLDMASGEDIVAINDRITTVEQGGRWSSTVTYESGSMETVALELGRFHRFDISAYGGGDILTTTLPLVTVDDVGRRISVSVVSGLDVGPSNGEVKIATTSAQPIDGRTLPLELAGVRPKIVFVAVVIVTDVSYGWSVESWGSDP